MELGKGKHIELGKGKPAGPPFDLHLDLAGVNAEPLSDSVTWIKWWMFFAPHSEWTEKGAFTPAYKGLFEWAVHEEHKSSQAAQFLHSAQVQAINKQAGAASINKQPGRVSKAYKAGPASKVYKATGGKA